MNATTATTAAADDDDDFIFDIFVENKIIIFLLS
jgi:hypothetical protein